MPFEKNFLCSKMKGKEVETDVRGCVFLNDVCEPGRKSGICTSCISGEDGLFSPIVFKRQENVEAKKMEGAAMGWLRVRG